MRWRINGVRIALLASAALLAGCQINDTRPGIAQPPAIDTATAQRQIVVTLRNPPGAALQRAGSTPKGYAARLAYGVSSQARRDSTALARKFKLTTAAEWPIDLLGVHCIVFNIPEDQQRSNLIAQLAADPRVESVQPLQTFATRARTTSYDDPYFGLQQTLTRMDVQNAHRYSLGTGVRVAVIDTRVDITHPDLAGHVIATRDFADAPEPGQFLQDAAHGTAVAGVIAAAANNKQGIVGVAPEARILALSACWRDNTGTATQRGEPALCNSFTLAQALAASVELKADVINLSLAGPPDPLLTRLVRRAIDRGAIVVGAVPDETPNAVTFPGSVPGVIAVQSAEAARADSTAVIYAPGKDVLTLRPGGTYDFDTGSSIAAAEVSGIVALLRSRQPTLDGARVRDLLAGSHQQQVASSATAMVNACAAMKILLKHVASCATR